MVITRTYNLLTCLIGSFFMLACSICCSGQIVLTSPLENQVLQRNLSDSATIAISGYTHFPYQNIKLTLTPISEGGTVLTKNVDSEQIRQGFIHERMRATKGWYRLLAVGTRSDGRQDSTQIEKVGIGEVFLVAGNSNAMGVQGLGAKSSSENVMTFDTINKTLDRFNITVAEDIPMQHPHFSPYDSQAFSYPTGETSWLWGELGDILYERMNTPVLFLNAGWAAANSHNYKDAASGIDAYNHYVGKNWPYQQPFTNITNTLQYFHSWLGIRAVLWSHGENDAYDLGIDQESYFNNIKFLIDRSRQDFGAVMPWVIGRSTVTWSANKPYQPVIAAQTELGSLSGFHTWLGPDSDTIQVPRPSHGHFENVPGGTQGISLAAKAWSRSLSNVFFNTVTPLQPSTYIHSGPIPATSAPGASFYLPFVVAGNTTSPIRLQAELLTGDGRYMANIGEGSTSPMLLRLPNTLKAATYLVRLVSAENQLTGSISAPIAIQKGLPTQLTRGLSAEQTKDGIQLSWLSCPHPEVKEMVLRRTNDQRSFESLQVFTAMDNQFESKTYAYLDQPESEQTVYYELIRRFTNGQEENTGRIVVFQGQEPPAYRIFPNPSSDQKFYIRPIQSVTPDRISMTDIHGREQPIQINFQSIIGLIEVHPTRKLPTGTYILCIQTEGRAVNQTLVLK